MTPEDARKLSILPGRRWPLGATAGNGGVNFAVFSEAATKVELCLFSADGALEIARIALPDRTGPVWHGFAPGLRPGALYGFRAHGPFAPEQGHRFNPAKLLADPYARSFHGAWSAADEAIGHVKTPSGDRPCLIDSASFTPKSVVHEPDQQFSGAAHPNRPWAETVIYEAHVKGLTQLHPGVPEDLRGTYEALGCDAVIDHLTGLGVTALELLPIHAFLDDGFLVERGLTNYWGYNTASFFAPEPRYYGPNGPDGLRRAIDRLHAAGIEVILDVVYNHTAEGDHRGPTLSFRGLDNAAYYQLQAGHKRHYVNDSGCGNTVNVGHPFALRLVMDSLRYWVEVMGVDGFRFDLATTLGREPQGFDPRGGFFDAIQQDPVLSRCKLIAEPWDIGPGGYRLGGFPAEWGEWNDRYRDSVRRFWRGDAHAAQDLAGGLLGTASIFDRPGRKPASSVNFIAAHDGFTLADVTRYSVKHNVANGENGADGHGENFSDNCGEEGDTTDPAIIARRAQRARNMLATLFLSQGVPMIQAGDEFGRSQRGNNNAYCQDNALTWLDWADADQGLLAFTRRLIQMRADNPVLRQERFLHGETAPDGMIDVIWTRFDGGALNWRDPNLRGFCVQLRGALDAPEPPAGAVMIAMNAGGADQTLILPALPHGDAWERALDTAAPDAAASLVEASRDQMVTAESIQVFILRAAAA